MPRTDTCEMTRFLVSKRSRNAVCIAYPLLVCFCSHTVTVS